MKYFLYKPTDRVYREITLKKVLSETLTIDPDQRYLDTGKDNYVVVSKTNPKIVEISFWEYWYRRIFK